MKVIHGICLPSTDTHFDNMIGEPFIAGRGTYQFKKYKAALGHVSHRGHAVDIGAHVGLWSRVMAIDFEQVSSFEPIAMHRDCFRENVKAPNVTLYPYALSDRSETVAFTVPADNTGHTHVARKEAVSEAANAIPLDSLTLPKIDFLKIDVEGYELQVVLGAQRTITRDRPVVIIEQKPHGNAERYGNKQHDARDILVQLGMRQIAVISGDHILAWV